MQPAITFNELEWRSDALGASAGRVISNIAKQSQLAVRHYNVIFGLHSTNSAMLDLLQTLHTSDSIQVLELAPPDRLRELGRKLLDVHNKVRTVVLQIRSFDLGFWRKAYHSSLKNLELHNLELSAHAQALMNADSPLVLLSERDQAFVLESLAASREPNEAMRRAFARK